MPYYDFRCRACGEVFEIRRSMSEQAEGVGTARRVQTGRTTLVVSHGPVREIDPDLHLPLREGRVAEDDPSFRSEAAR